MKKALFMTLSASFVFWLVCLFSYDKNLLLNAFKAQKAEAVSSSTQVVNLSVTVQDYLSFLVSSGGNINLGNLTPRTANCNQSGTVLSVDTNAANGYKMTPSDGFATSSALVHTDASTPIVDFVSGTVAAPVVWSLSTVYGLGVTLWSGSTAVAAPWSVAGGAPADACVVASTKWAAVGTTSATTTGLTVTGPIATTDYSKWGWKVNVDNTQKTGVYAGTVTFTVVNVLS